ncbi:hypothetical protein MNB_SV-8-271 [hydrothermal vent metagenome]|uniref:Uncharacterized protein n=1 Tax=hydrothermal vent metagenome TaxID=652676 RepID=A0A1W1C063_9ZZZZ
MLLVGYYKIDIFILRQTEKDHLPSLHTHLPLLLFVSLPVQPPKR